MAEWIKVKPPESDIAEAIGVQYVRTDRISEVRQIGIKVQVRTDGWNGEWLTAHDASENTQEFGKLVAALDLFSNA